MTISHQPAARLVMKQQPSSDLEDQIPGTDHWRSVIAAQTRGSGQESDTGQFEPLLDTGEAARLLRIHPRTLLRSARRGKIPAIRVGRLWRFRASVLNQWLKTLAR